MGLVKRFKEWRASRQVKKVIIDNHHDLPIGKYLECVEITKSEIDEIDKATALLGILTGWSEADVENLSVNEYATLASGCGWLYAPMIPAKLEKEYQLGEFRVVVSDADTITTAQYIDFQSFVKDTNKYIIELLSALLVPKGKRYGEGYSLKELQQSIRDYLPTDVATTMVAFFLNRLRQLTADIPHSLEEEVKNAPAKTEMQKAQKKKALQALANLRKNGGGL